MEKDVLLSRGIQPKKKMTIGYSKLTEKQVLEILDLKKQGFSQTEIARKFGVHRQTISNICNGKTLSSITGIKCRE